MFVERKLELQTAKVHAHELETYNNNINNNNKGSFQVVYQLYE